MNYLDIFDYSITPEEDSEMEFYDEIDDYIYDYLFN